MLEATLEATHDGIVVVDLDRRVIVHNTRFLKMFGLTREQVERSTSTDLLAALTPQLENVDTLLERSKEIWAHPETPAFDVMRFTDGRVYQRYVAPHRIGNEIVGLVASYRDIGEAVRA